MHKVRFIYMISASNSSKLVLWPGSCLPMLELPMLTRLSTPLTNYECDKWLRIHIYLTIKWQRHRPGFVNVINVKKHILLNFSLQTVFVFLGAGNLWINEERQKNGLYKLVDCICLRMSLGLGFVIEFCGVIIKLTSEKNIRSSHFDFTKKTFISMRQKNRPSIC